MPALAAPSVANPLKVDIQGRYGNTTLPGWTDWGFGVADGTWVSPQSTTIDGTSLTLAVIRKDGSNQGLSRNRSGGFAHVPRTATNNYIGQDFLCLYIDSLVPGECYQISLWSLEKRSIWSNKPTTVKMVNWAQFPNPDTEYECANDWLIENGYPDGYDPCSPSRLDGSNPTDPCTGIPKALYDMVTKYGYRASVVGPESDDLLPGGCNLGKSAFNIKADAYGNATVCGWLDINELEGSFHVPLNAFMIIPEPATMVLLVLGGLALLRRKRA